MKIEPGDLVLVKGKCWPSFFIRLFLKSDYTHMTIAIDENHVCEVDLFTKMQIIPNPYKEFDLYRCHQSLSPEQQKVMTDFLKKRCQTSKGYDWWRIISLIIKRYFRINLIIHEQDKYICSEIVDKAYQHIGIDLIEHRVTGDVTPLDFIETNHLSLVFSSLKENDFLSENRKIDL